MCMKDQGEDGLGGAPTNNRHPLAHIAEVQDSQQFVDFGFPHFDYHDDLRSTGTEHKAKVPGSSDQGTFIWGLSLVHQLTWQERGGQLEPTDVQLKSTQKGHRLPNAYIKMEPRRDTFPLNFLTIWP